MAKINIKSVFTALAAAAMMAVAAFIAPVSAEDDPSGYHVQISPATQKISLEPGDVYRGTFKVSNIGEKEFEYTLSAIPYSVTNDNYDPDYDTRNSRNQLADWITFDTESGKIKPNVNNEIHYTVTVPEDVPGGGQYAALAVSVNNGEEGSIQTISRVVLKLYAKVAGDTREEGEILENKVTNFVFGGGKITATSKLSNTGNVDADATYTVRIYPFGSGEEVYTNEAEPDVRTILPDTERYNTVIWEETPSLGLYTVEQTIDYLGQTSTTKKFVIVCPLWLIVIFIALIFAIIFTLVSRARARKLEEAESSNSRNKK